MTWSNYSRKRTLVPTEELAGWATQPVLSFWSKEEFLAPARIQTPDRPGCIPVAILTAIYRFPHKYTVCVKRYGRWCIGLDAAKQQVTNCQLITTEDQIRLHFSVYLFYRTILHPQSIGMTFLVLHIECMYVYIYIYDSFIGIQP